MLSWVVLFAFVVALWVLAIMSLLYLLTQLSLYCWDRWIGPAVDKINFLCWMAYWQAHIKWWDREEAAKAKR